MVLENTKNNNSLEKICDILIGGLILGTIIIGGITGNYFCSRKDSTTKISQVTIPYGFQGQNNYKGSNSEPSKSP